MGKRSKMCRRFSIAAVQYFQLSEKMWCLTIETEEEKKIIDNLYNMFLWCSFHLESERVKSFVWEMPTAIHIKTPVHNVCCHVADCSW